MPIIISANPQITPDIGNRVLALLQFLSIMNVTHDSHFHRSLLSFSSPIGTPSPIQNFRSFVESIIASFLGGFILGRERIKITGLDATRW